MSTLIKTTTLLIKKIYIISKTSFWTAQTLSTIKNKSTRMCLTNSVQNKSTRMCLTNSVQNKSTRMCLTNSVQNKSTRMCLTNSVQNKSTRMCLTNSVQNKSTRMCLTNSVQNPESCSCINISVLCFSSGVLHCHARIEWWTHQHRILQSGWGYSGPRQHCTPFERQNGLQQEAGRVPGESKELTMKSSTTGR